MYIILSMLSGAFHALSLPGFNLEVLSFVFLIPLLRVIRNSSPFAGGLYGTLYFASTMLISHFWLMSTLMKNFSELLGYKPYLGFFTFLLFLLYESLFFFVFGFLAALFKNRINEGIYMYIFIPALYTFMDYIRSIGDLGYTGGIISDSLYKNHLFLWLFSVIGSYGVEFFIILVNSYLSTKRPKSVLYIISIFYLLFYTTNILFSPAISDGGFRLELLQTNFDPIKRYSKSATALTNLKKDNSIIVTPEAFYSVYPVNFDNLSSLPERVLIGTSLKKGERYYNSVVYNEGGKLQIYSKVKLFPFAEFLPYPKLFRFLSFLKKFHYYNPGNGYIPIKIDGKKVGMLICFETFFEKGAIDYSNNGTDFILVSTNDGWFNSKIALWQHFAKAVIRAAETGQWVVQVANKGISGVIDSYGRIRVVLPTNVEMKKGVTVGKPHLTLYPKIHRFVPFVLIGILIIVILFSKSGHYIKVSKIRS